MARPTTPARGVIGEWGRELLVDHLGYVKRAADKVAREYKFGAASQESQDLNSAGLMLACEVAQRYHGTRESDPKGVLFRGYLKVGLAHELRREARRLRNGGTYWSRAETPGVALLAVPLSDFAESDRDDDGATIYEQARTTTAGQPLAAV